MRYPGVDLHKTNFVVCFLADDDKTHTETFTLDHPGLARFKRCLRRADKLAVEASANSFYFCRQVKDCVSGIVVVDTHRFAVIARSKSKTDKKDAASLARFLKLGCLPQVPIPTEQIERLRTICIRAVLSQVNRAKTPLMEFYQKKKREKGSGKAIVATARKLLVIVFVMLKKELDYWYIEERLYNEKLKALRAAA
jgi:transposase